MVSLETQYTDKDARKAEIDAFTAPAQPGDLSEFYAWFGEGLGPLQQVS
jgi:splicing factor 3A subunit 3